MNSRYAAGWSSEFDDILRTLTIREDSVVMFRNTKGNVTALEDRCPLRLLPLSKGKRIGDDIHCGHHGMTFNREGKCVRVSGQKTQ